MGQSGIKSMAGSMSNSRIKPMTFGDITTGNIHQGFVQGDNGQTITNSVDGMTTTVELGKDGSVITTNHITSAMSLVTT